MRKCQYCGEEIVGKGKSVCAACRAAEGRADDAYRKMRAEEKKREKRRKRCLLIDIAGLPEAKLDRKKCRTCLYRLHLCDGEKVWRCGYCYFTGHIRPCDISSDCSVYEKYTEKKRKKLTYEMKNTI